MQESALTNTNYNCSEEDGGDNDLYSQTKTDADFGQSQNDNQNQ